ncbi:hypothetical protein [Microcoleus sp. B9-D4]|uniref:hypothetical protein n=1 Tax=Microcoleus sp. B9-D4 TaxID=2818711 RepID=UPI002FCF0358
MNLSFNAAPSVKEFFFAAFLSSYGNPKAVGGGREGLMLETLENYGEFSIALLNSKTYKRESKIY